MNALCISDLHAHFQWPFSQPVPHGYPTRFQDLLDVLRQVETLVAREQPTDLLILGDVLHRRHFIKFELLNAMLDAIGRLARMVRQTVILVGNHDIEAGAVHGLVPFGYLPNTVVVDQPGIVTLSDGDQVCALPYLHAPELMTQAVEHAPAVPVIAHYATEGVPLANDYWLDSPLKLGEMGRFPLTLFGHVHQPSDLLGGRVVYLGAPLAFDFGDHGPRRCVTVRDRAWTSHPLTAPVMATVRWPRIPPAPPQGGYVRILDVPDGALEEATRIAVRVGWRDALPLRAALPPEVQQALASGLVVDVDLLRAHVARRCPELPPDEQEALVAEGVRYLEGART